MENEAYGNIIGSSSAPYLNGLAASCGLATNYAAISHPSLPNYIALTSGGTQGIADDGEPSAHRLGVASIFSQLGGNWLALEESMPTRCDKMTSGQYGRGTTPPSTTPTSPPPARKRTFRFASRSISRPHSPSSPRTSVTTCTAAQWRREMPG